MTQERRPARLRAIKLYELSLVDAPANPHARVTLFKRDVRTEKEETMLQKNEPLGFDTLDDAVEHLQNTLKCGRTQAMSRAAERFPTLVAKFNDEGREIARRAAEDLAKSRTRPGAVEDFLKLQCLPQALEPADMVGPVLFLASDASRMMTGQALVVDGGVVTTG